MDKITENIYIGDSGDAVNEHLIRENGVTAILNVAHDLNPAQIRGLDKDYYSGILSMKCGLQDGTYSLNHDLADIAITMLVKAIEKGHTVMVHCHAGQNRSLFITAHALARINNTKFDDECEFVISKRPQAFRKPWMDEVNAKLG
jgi:protein-tyrosine phosphatase